MTTKDSPPEQLHAQAHRIAAILKRAGRGEHVASDPAGKLAASRERGIVDFAIVMDDNILTIQIPWKTIDELAMPLLCDFIFDQMSEAKHVAN